MGSKLILKIDDKSHYLNKKKEIIKQIKKEIKVNMKSPYLLIDPLKHILYKVTSNTKYI